jgi:hypothetical protein
MTTQAWRTEHHLEYKMDSTAEAYRPNTPKFLKLKEGTESPRRLVKNPGSAKILIQNPSLESRNLHLTSVPSDSTRFGNHQWTPLAQSRPDVGTAAQTSDPRPPYPSSSLSCRD